MTKKLVAVVLGLAALLLNPLVACRLLEQDFSFGATEMRAAVEGTWTVTVPTGGDTPASAYTITIAQRSLEDMERETSSSSVGAWIAPAAACGTRSLVASASACLDVTKMQLTVTIVKGPSSGATGATASKGLFQVYGKQQFKAGRLELTLDGKDLRAVVSSTGVATDVELGSADVEMVRVAPAAPAAAPKT